MEILKPSTIDGYLIAECGSYYGDIKQRWLVVESEQRKQSDLLKIEKRLANKSKQAQSRLKKLSQQEFACKPDAQKALELFES